MFQTYRTEIIVSICVIFLSLFLIYFFYIPYSVEHFYTLHIGRKIPHQVQTETKDFDGTVIFTGSKFYVYLVQKEIDWCVAGGCGMSGALVECMGGRFVGEAVNLSAGEYGLTENDIEAGKSVVVVADKDQSIVGIYPNQTIQQVPYILKNHRNLSDKFDFCYKTQMPKRWKNINIKFN